MSDHGICGNCRTPIYGGQAYDWYGDHGAHRFASDCLAPRDILIAELRVELARLKGRETELLEANNLDLERRRRAERERDNMRATWERAWAQPTAEEYQERIRGLLVSIGKMATGIKAAIQAIEQWADGETGHVLQGTLDELRALIGPPRKHQPFEYDPTSVSLEDRVAHWVRTRLGAENLHHRERSMRLLEEAIELAQAEGITPDQVAKQVAHVFARPSGEPSQEAAGIAVCLLGWCAATGNSLLDLAHREIERIEAKPVEQIRGSLARKADADLVTCVPEVPRG